MTEVAGQDPNIADLMKKVEKHFDPASAEGINTSIQLHLSGPKGGEWNIIIANKECRVNSGVIPNPQLTLMADAQDCLDVFMGRIDGMKAFMQGKLRLSGDMMLAMKLSKLFK